MVFEGQRNDPVTSLQPVEIADEPPQPWIPRVALTPAGIPKQASYVFRHSHSPESIRMDP